MKMEVQDANMSHNPYEIQLSDLVAPYPTLTMFGFADRRSDNFKNDRDGLLKGKEDFYKARNWLAPLVGHRRIAAARGCRSYFLKEQYELDTSDYVANGFFIAAAIDLGLFIKEEGPNAMIGIRFPASKRLLQRRSTISTFGASAGPS